MRHFTPLRIVTLLAIVAAAAGLSMSLRRAPEPVESAALAAAAAPAARPAVETATPPLAPHPQADLPPLRFEGYPLARTPDVTAAVYRFAAEHPEILSYVPCYCGCERQGHRGNEDCFVAARGVNGDVTEWEPHGMT